MFRIHAATIILFSGILVLSSSRAGLKAAEGPFCTGQPRPGCAIKLAAGIPSCWNWPYYANCVSRCPAYQGSSVNGCVKRCQQNLEADVGPCRP